MGGSTVARVVARSLGLAPVLRRVRRALTADATALAAKLAAQEADNRAMAQQLAKQEAEIADLAKRVAELDRYQGPLTVMRARGHLERALSHVSPNQPSYGSRWQPQIDAIRRDIPALRDPLACLHYAQKEITFDGRPPFPSDMMSIQFREWAVENEFPHLTSTLRRMYDNPLSYPESLGEFNGRTVSRIFYCHARIVLAGMTYADRPRRILEIGGGYGEIARLWLTNSWAPAESFVIVDIPESLFFAEIALKAEFGDQVAYFEGHDPGARILLVPIPYLGQLTRAADLVVNTGSMQEMTDEWIDFYVAWLAKYDTRFFYSLNYIAQPIAVMGESRNLWSQRLGPEWSTRHHRLNIPLLDLEGPTRDFLEALYEKVSATQRLDEWSIYRGHMLSKTTYVEGLDLLRQDFTVANARKFVDTVLEQMPYHPKELLYIVEWLIRQGERGLEERRATLRTELGGFLSHAPAPPTTS
jgi:SAM-dependent methyltransferase